MSQAQILIERFNKADDKAQFIEDERKLQPLITEQYTTYEYWLLVDMSIVKVKDNIIDECDTIRECDTITEKLLREVLCRYNAVLTEVQREEQSEHDCTEFFERVTKIAHGDY